MWAKALFSIDYSSSAKLLLKIHLELPETDNMVFLNGMEKLSM
jgi:hypothetical protein